MAPERISISHQLRSLASFVQLVCTNDTGYFSIYILYIVYTLVCTSTISEGILIGKMRNSVETRT